MHIFGSRSKSESICKISEGYQGSICKYFAPGLPATLQPTGSIALPPVGGGSPATVLVALSSIEFLRIPSRLGRLCSGHATDTDRARRRCAVPSLAARAPQIKI
jgi:hypothetical protein